MRLDRARGLHGIIGASVSEPHLGSSTRPLSVCQSVSLSVCQSVYIYIYIYIILQYKMAI